MSIDIESMKRDHLEKLKKRPPRQFDYEPEEAWTELSTDEKNKSTLRSIEKIIFEKQLHDRKCDFSDSCDCYCEDFDIDYNDTREILREIDKLINKYDYMANECSPFDRELIRTVKEKS